MENKKKPGIEPGKFVDFLSALVKLGHAILQLFL